MKSHETLVELFGKNVFSDDVMRVRLPQGVYKALRKTMEDGDELSPDVAEVVAAVMKEWAVEKGATHFTHWFQPMTGQTAEKHDAFLTPFQGGRALLEFSGKELIKGEADGSAFPTGGLRATFEARGYTAWDTTSPAFIREDPGGIIALCIPTAFCSYTGDALDTRVPLLRSMQALNTQALRVLHAMGQKGVRHVSVTVGLEQEYYLINRDLSKKRKDLIYTGRTLFGAPPPKGQEMDDQYYAAIRQRVSEFMKEANEELWRLGVPAKTQHNEGAPAQHELAVVHAPANIAADQNQLTMMMLRKVAARRGLSCLLHEKPFDVEGMAGSGKHNNWSLSTDDGRNLLDPGKNPQENLVFLIFFMAVIAAVDAHAPLLRLGCASASNDLRLGGHEAPPAVISVFVGEALSNMLDALEKGEVPIGQVQDAIKLGVPTIPALPMDDADRNRTSPFAFTGNKFELRMLGSSEAAGTVNTLLNTMVAQSLDNIAGMLESRGETSMEEAVMGIVSILMKKHKRVLFGGDNYTHEWLEEAHKRGLPNLLTTVDAVPALLEPSSVALFETYQVFSRQELESRVCIRLDRYVKTINIEALTMLSMVRSDILPCTLAYHSTLCDQITAAQKQGVSHRVHSAILTQVEREMEALYDATILLEKEVEKAGHESTQSCARAWQSGVRPAMAHVRAAADALETLLPKAVWPLPTYGDLLYYV